MTKAQQLPITDLEEAILAACDIAIFGIKTAETKKLDFLAALQLAPAIQLGIEGYKNIVPQAIDIDSAEATQLVAKVAAKFSTTNNKAKKIIIAVTKLVAPAIELVEAVTGE